LSCMQLIGAEGKRLHLEVLNIFIKKKLWNTCYYYSSIFFKWYV